MNQESATALAYAECQEFVEHGYEVEIVSPDGGKLEVDAFSNPEDKSKYSEEDILSLGFLKSRKHRALIDKTKALAEVDPTAFDALLVIGGQGPMYTLPGQASPIPRKSMRTTQRG